MQAASISLEGLGFGGPFQSVRFLLKLGLLVELKSHSTSQSPKPDPNQSPITKPYKPKEPKPLGPKSQNPIPKSLNPEARILPPTPKALGGLQPLLPLRGLLTSACCFSEAGPKATGGVGLRGHVVGSVEIRDEA